MSNLKIVLLIVFSMALAFLAAHTIDFASAKDEEDEESKPAFMGIYPRDLEEDDEEALEWGEKYGILIEDVIEDGPAKKAGLQGGDILIQIDDDKIKNLKGLRKVLSKHQALDNVKALYVRDGKKHDAKLILAAGPSRKIEFSTQKEIGGKRGFLGVFTQELSDQLREFFKVDHGVLIQTVEDETPAAKAGLKAGDVIMDIDKDAINTPDELMKAMRSRKPNTEVNVHYSRNGQTMDVKFVLGEAQEPVIVKKMLEDIQITGLEDYIREAIEKDEDWEEAKEDLHEAMEELREELEQLKQELKKMQDEPKKTK